MVVPAGADQRLAEKLKRLVNEMSIGALAHSWNLEGYTMYRTVQMSKENLRLTVSRHLKNLQSSGDRQAEKWPHNKDDRFGRISPRKSLSKQHQTLGREVCNFQNFHITFCKMPSFQNNNKKEYKSAKKQESMTHT